MNENYLEKKDYHLKNKVSLLSGTSFLLVSDYLSTKFGSPYRYYADFLSFSLGLYIGRKIGKGLERFLENKLNRKKNYSLYPDVIGDTDYK
ncbi:MAG: hypothetical protein QW273_02960 [Candidatus Pacearchaeota archaeon]